MASNSSHLQDAAGLIARGQFAQALAICRQVAEAEPGNADAWRLAGISSRQQGDIAGAVSSLARAAQLDVSNGGLHFALAECHWLSGRLADAESALRRAVELEPQSSRNLTTLGSVLNAQQKYEEAMAAFGRALELDSDSPDIHYELALSLAAQGNPHEAISAYRRAIERKQDFTAAHCNLGMILQSMGQYSQSAECFRRVLELKPDLLIARLSLGAALQAQGQVEAAIEQYELALEQDPRSADAHGNLGTARRLQNRYDEALASYDRALSLNSTHVGARVNRALALLVQGDYLRGWKEYEARWEWPGVSRSFFTHPMWNGEPLRGRTLLVYAEQTLGDVFQLIRYVKLMADRGDRVVCQVPQHLVPLLRKSGMPAIVGRGDPLPRFDVHAGMVSLPHLLGTTLDTVPKNVPYLFADEGLVEVWRRRLRPFEGLKIGIAWQGNPLFADDWLRSFPLSSMAPLPQSGVQLISLQKGPGSEQVSAVAGDFQVLCLDGFDEEKGPFTDTAAIMKNLDLVVTCDTSIAHLAGALGVPVWLALAWVPDWRWLTEREDSPWYPTVRLFRQTRLGEWDEVFQRMAAELREMVAARNEDSRPL